MRRLGLRSRSKGFPERSVFDGLISRRCRLWVGVLVLGACGGKVGGDGARVSGAVSRMVDLAGEGLFERASWGR